MGPPILVGLKLVLVQQSLELGGAERQGLYLADYLHDRCGADVEIWGIDTPGRIVDICKARGIPCRSVPVRWRRSRRGRLVGMLRLSHALRQAQPDVLLPYTNPPNVLCGNVWRWTGARACIWNQRDVGLHRMGRRLEHRAVSSMSGFLSNSDVGLEWLTQEHDLPAHRPRRVIRNAVFGPETPPDRAEARRALGLASDAKVAVMIAHLSDSKDHETLIRAWALVRERLRDSVLLLAGRDYGPGTALRLLAFDLGLSSRNVRFLGAAPDPERLLAAADLAVHSARSEASPNAVLEAMAMGLPVVGTDIAGIRDVLGVVTPLGLAPLGDPVGLADIIQSAFCDRVAATAVGRANRERISTAFDPETNLSTTAGFIGEMAG
ncbi:MAG: glycosyltransferase [Chthonomonadales bacterium]|nr:glycosyltransferase [Chthonomonadales bacterium]